MSPREGETSPSPGPRDAHLLCAADEPEGVRGEGDTTWKTAQVLVGLTPDAGAERPHGVLSRAVGAAVRDGGDPPQRALRDQPGREIGHMLPSAPRWGDARPGRRHRRVRQRQLIGIRPLRQRFHDQVAAQLGIGVHDAHRQDRGRLVEQPLRGERGGGDGEHAARRLQADAVGPSLRRAAGEGQHVAGGVGVGENERSGHPF
ncbi:MAG: hypothetical protein BGN97_00585 [Microbacterium sp. 69-10]|nr:MAG: hypothetical protein BGN97_00585 [Microbacterium sp. 69-10]